MPKKKQNLTTEEYQSEVLDIHRKLLGGVLLQDIKTFDHLTGQDRIEFLRFCAEMYNNPWFEEIFSALHFPHIEYAAKKAPNYDVVTFNRATANGISLAKEFFKKYERIYTNQLEGKEEEFDDSKPFESIIP